MNQELQNYIKKAKEAGMNDGQIKQELLKAGWQEQDVNQEFGGTFVPTPTPKVETFSTTIDQGNKSKLPKIILFASIAIVLIVAGILGYIYLIKPTAPSVTEKVLDINKDYGTDFNGFIDVAKNCPTAKVKWVANVDFLGAATESIQHEIELKGLDSDQKCIFIDKNTIVGFQYSEEMIEAGKKEDSTLTDEKIKQDELDTMAGLKKTVNVVYTCYFDIDYLSEMLNNWSKGTVSENDFTSDKCTGIDENGKKVNLLGENNVIDMSNAKWTAYLGSGSSQSYGNISLKANSIVSGQINITITNTDTGENKTVSLKAGESVDLLGKKISVVEFKRENNIDRATVTVE